jgi:hypothetical protein
LEKTAKIYVFALSLGKVNVVPTDAAEVEKAYFKAVYGESQTD